MQVISVTLAGWQLIVDGIPAPSQYMSLLDPAIAAFNSLPNPPSSLLDSVQTKITDLVDDVQSVSRDECCPSRDPRGPRTGIPD